jgi:hypothetical protein
MVTRLGLCDAALMEVWRTLWGSLGMYEVRLFDGWRRYGQRQQVAGHSVRVKLWYLWLLASNRYLNDRSGRRMGRFAAAG